METPEYIDSFKTVGTIKRKQDGTYAVPIHRLYGLTTYHNGSKTNWNLDGREIGYVLDNIENMVPTQYILKQGNQKFGEVLILHKI